MDMALGQAAEEFKLKWDRSKDWKNGVHLGVNLDKRKHQKYRENKANAAFMLIKRLTRLPPREKKIVVSQPLLILTYGAVLHSVPSERGKAMAAEWNRFITGGWRGSSRQRLADIAGVMELEQAMEKKKIRWAASVYERGVKGLKEVAERILRNGSIETNTVFRWPVGTRDRIKQLEVLE